MLLLNDIEVDIVDTRDVWKIPFAPQLIINIDDQPHAYYVALVSTVQRHYRCVTSEPRRLTDYAVTYPCVWNYMIYMGDQRAARQLSYDMTIDDVLTALRQRAWKKYSTVSFEEAADIDLVYWRNDQWLRAVRAHYIGLDATGLHFPVEYSDDVLTFCQRYNKRRWGHGGGWFEPHDPRLHGSPRLHGQVVTPYDITYDVETGQQAYQIYQRALAERYVDDVFALVIFMCDDLIALELFFHPNGRKNNPPLSRAQHHSHRLQSRSPEITDRPVYATSAQWRDNQHRSCNHQWIDLR